MIVHIVEQQRNIEEALMLKVFWKAVILLTIVSNEVSLVVIHNSFESVLWDSLATWRAA